jgi:DNA-binding beta-propeller fold protein YncE
LPAPEFPDGLDWLNTDHPLSIAELRGKLVLLDFWTYGCINCIHIIPDLKRLEAEYPDELVVIGVHSAKFTQEGDTENIRQIILRYGLEHPVVNDKDFRVWSIWGANAWPTLFLIDPAGNVVGVHSGEGVYPLFKPVIESLVQEFDRTGQPDRTPLERKLEREGLPASVLSFPGKVLAAAGRDRLFVADTNHQRVLVVQLSSGRVLQSFGSGRTGLHDGPAAEASFWNPQGMALSADGSTLYVADTDNHAVRRIDLGAGQVTTLVGTGQQARQYPPAAGQAPNVELTSPWDLALDGQVLYIAMAGSHQIWRINLTSGLTEPFAGSGREGTLDGPLDSAELAQPSGLALDGAGRLYFADSEGSSIRWAEIAGAHPQVGTLAGSGTSLFDFGDVDGIGNQARLQHPLGVALAGDQLYVADTYNSKIKRVDLGTLETTTFLGGGHGWRDGTDPQFYEPGGLSFDGGRLYVADTNNHAIRIVDPDTGDTSTLVISGIEAFQSVDLDTGEELELPEVELQAGQGKVVLDIELPPGYKINPLAPSSFQWRTTGEAIEFPSNPDSTVMGPEFPLQLPAFFYEGQGTLTGEFAVYYCEARTESLCLIEQLRVTVPVSVGSSGDRELVIRHSIPLPEIR